MCFGAFYVQTFVGSACDMHKKIGVCLLGGSLAAVTFRIGHAGTDNNIVLLRLFNEV